MKFNNLNVTGTNLLIVLAIALAIAVFAVGDTPQDLEAGFGNLNWGEIDG